MTPWGKNSLITELTGEMERANADAARLLKLLREVKTEAFTRLPSATPKQEEMWQYLQPANPKSTEPQEQMITGEQEAEIQRLEDEIARQEIMSRYAGTGKDAERDRALLELERQQELRRAGSQFGTPGMESVDAQSRILGNINRLFDQRLMEMELGAREAAFSAIDATRSTFSGEEAWRMGLGNKPDDPAKKTEKNTAAIAKSVEETARETKMMRHAIQSGLRMGP